MVGRVQPEGVIKNRNWILPVKYPVRITRTEIYFRKSGLSQSRARIPKSGGINRNFYFRNTIFPKD